MLLRLESLIDSKTMRFSPVGRHAFEYENEDEYDKSSRKNKNLHSSTTDNADS